MGIRDWIILGVGIASVLAALGAAGVALYAFKKQHKQISEQHDGRTKQMSEQHEERMKDLNLQLKETERRHKEIILLYGHSCPNCKDYLKEIKSEMFRIDPKETKKDA